MAHSAAKVTRLGSSAAWRLQPARGAAITGIVMIPALVGAVVMLVPFVWAVLSSLKPESELTLIPPTWLPRVWTVEGYVVAWTAGKMWIGVRNSLIVSTISSALMVLGAALAGYAFARLRFPAKGPLFLIILGTMMIPWPVTLLPLYTLILHVPLAGGNDLFGIGGRGLINTYAGLILPHLSYPYGIYLTREFFKGLPVELEDAARVDGAGELRILFTIVMPLSKPVLAALAILAFQGNWSAFIWPLVITSSPGMNTVQLSLQQLQYLIGEFAIRWNVVTAGGVMAIVPVVIAFLFGQRYFTRGIAMTGFR
jgi:multiple sugar transport system permease protein